MLIVANGAYKSGSTWLYYILKLLSNFGSPPAQFLVKWKHPSLALDKISRFLDTGMHKESGFLVKQHLTGSQLEKFLPYLDKDILFFDIERDYRDVVVSAFHHDKLDGFLGGFRLFYWLRGRFVHSFVKKYHLDMIRIIPPELLFIINYSTLLYDFPQELRKIAKALNIDLTSERILKIKQETSFTEMRNRYDKKSIIHGKKFFRRGIAGDYSNYYGPLELRDFREIEGIATIKLVSLLGMPISTAFRAAYKTSRFLKRIK